MPRLAGPATLARKLGARIRALRLEAAITQEKLAWESDLDKGYLSQLESGKRLPSLPVLFRLAARLEVEVADLLGFDLRRPRLKLLDAARTNDRDAVREALQRLDLA
jgi:transcriptional regulator with XRE-family HTH domain